MRTTAVKNHRHAGGVCIFFDKEEAGKFFTASELVFKEYEPYAMNETSPVVLDDTESQKLMDDLWDCGIRPSEGTGSAGCLSATQKHLSDMRSIVSNKLKVEL